jgi:CheY-like chemotaxis protein
MKTTHRGANIILGPNKKLKLPKIKNPIIITSEDTRSVLSLKIKGDEQTTRKTNLLIVEDEFIFAHDLKMTIEKMGYNVIGIEKTGEQAIKKVAETKPDLILMDIMLNGEIDGIDATYEIWERFKIPILYITAHSDKATMERIKESPNAGILVKPILSDALQQTIETTIGIAAGK